MLLNRARANDYMDRYGIDAIIAASPMNVSYLTDLDCWFYRIYKEFMVSPGGSNTLVPSFAILPRDGEPVLILGTDLAMFATRLWVKKVRTYGTLAGDLSSSPSFVSSLDSDEKRIYDALLFGKKGIEAQQALRSSIETIGLERSTLGIDCDNVCVDIRAPLSRMFPHATIKNCSQVMRFIRMGKSEEEIKRLASCASINEKAGIRSLRLIEPGVRVADVEQVYREAVARKGASFEHHIYSRYGLGNSADSNYQFRRGDVMLFDFGCVYQMYFSDTATTVMVGTSSSKLTRIYHSIRETMEQVADMIKPGTKSLTVFSTMSKLLADRGIRGSGCQGHGMGLDVRDYPIMTSAESHILSDDFMKATTDIPLEEGMVINLEIPFPCIAEASIGIEKTFLVTNTGCTEIVPQNRDNPIIT